MHTAEQIYLQYHDKVRAYVRGKIQDPHDVEDLVSAVFMKIVQKLDSYDPDKASVATWVYTITRNTVIDHYRTRRTLVALEDYMVDEAPAELTDDVLDSGLVAVLRTTKKVGYRVTRRTRVQSLRATGSPGIDESCACYRTAGIRQSRLPPLCGF